MLHYGVRGNCDWLNGRQWRVDKLADSDQPQASNRGMDFMVGQDIGTGQVHVNHGGFDPVMAHDGLKLPDASAPSDLQGSKSVAQRVWPKLRSLDASPGAESPVHLGDAVHRQRSLRTDP